MRRVAYEVNRCPSVVGASVLPAAEKCGHPLEAHAVLDDPEQFAIRKILRFRQTQIRWLGVEAIANHSLPAAVIAMTDGAMIREMQPRISQIFRRSKHRVLCQTRIRRDRELTRITPYHNS